MRRNENNKLPESVGSRHSATPATKCNRSFYNIWQFTSETKRNLWAGYEKRNGSSKSDVRRLKMWCWSLKGCHWINFDKRFSWLEPPVVGSTSTVRQFNAALLLNTHNYDKWSKKKILLFSNTCFGLKGHHQVEQKNKRTCMYVCVYIYIYTGCPRRNVPDFGRVFLTLKYTDITQNTYIQSWTVTEIMAREKCGLLAVPRTAPFQLTHYMYSAHGVETGMQSTLCLRAHVKCLEL